MKAKLRVLKGPSEGTEITIPVSKFFIGRGEDCHLRPKSDAISRHHCAIVISDDQVALRDFGSKNGTFVNDQRVESVAILNNGDKLLVGPLAFEIVLDHSLGGTKQPKIKGVEDVAERSASRSQEITGSDDDNVASWLETSLLEEQDTEKSDTVTRQFHLEETNKLEPVDADAETETDEEGEDDSQVIKGKKRKPMKLPPAPPDADNSEDSKQAAEEMLRKYFNRS